MSSTCAGRHIAIEGVDSCAAMRGESQLSTASGAGTRANSAVSGASAATAESNCCAARGMPAARFAARTGWSQRSTASGAGQGIQRSTSGGGASATSRKHSAVSAARSNCGARAPASARTGSIENISDSQRSAGLGAMVAQDSQQVSGSPGTASEISTSGVAQSSPGATAGTADAESAAGSRCRSTPDSGIPDPPIAAGRTDGATAWATSMVMAAARCGSGGGHSASGQGDAENSVPRMAPNSNGHR